MTTTEIAIAVGLTVTVIGCTLGLKERAVIFRNYDDLGLVFLAVVPLFIGFISLIQWILIPAMVASIALVTWLTWRTFVWDLLSPSGKTQLARAKTRGIAVAILAVITPLIYRLVKDKTGVLVPRDVLRNTRRGLTHGS